MSTTDITVDKLNQLIRSWEPGLLLFDDGTLSHKENLKLADNKTKAVRVISSNDDSITAEFFDGATYAVHTVSFLNTVEINTAFETLS